MFHCMASHRTVSGYASSRDTETITPFASPETISFRFYFHLIHSQVFVQVGVAVQYRVIVNGAYDAYYRLTDPRNQIQSYVFDVVRSTVPRMDLDEAFVSKDEVGSAVLAQLRDVMKDYGYEINKTLVTDLSPDNRVKASMNEINASRRLKEGKLDWIELN